MGDAAEEGVGGVREGEEARSLLGAPKQWIGEMTEEKERQAAIGIVGVSLFISSFLATFLIPILPDLRFRSGLSLFQTCAVFASFSLGEFAGTVVSGMLGGQIRCWMLLAIGQLFLFLYSVTYTATDSAYGIMFTARFLGGIAANVVRNAAFAIMSDIDGGRDSSSRNVILFFCIAFGLTMGPLLGGSLAGGETEYSALLAALVCAALMGGTFFFLRTNQTELPKREGISRDPKTALSLGAIALVGAIMTLAEVLLPLHLSIEFQTSPSALGGLFMIISIAFIFMANLTAILSERINRNYMLALGLIGTAMACILLTVPTSLAVEVVPVLMLGASASVVYGGALLRMVGGDDVRPLLLSQAACVARAAGGVVGAIAFAILASSFELGYDDATYTFGGIALLAAAFMGWRMKEEEIDPDEAVQVPAIADLQLQFTL